MKFEFVQNIDLPSFDAGKNIVKAVLPWPKFGSSQEFYVVAVVTHF